MSASLIPRGATASGWARFHRHPGGWAGLSLLSLSVVLTLLATWLPLPAPLTLPALTAVEAQTAAVDRTDLVRSVLAQLVWAAHGTLTIAGLATLVAASLGTALTVVAVAFGGPLRGLAGLLHTVLATVPTTVLTVTVLTLTSPDAVTTGFVLGLVNGGWLLGYLLERAEDAQTAPMLEVDRQSGRRGPGIVSRRILPILMPGFLLVTAEAFAWVLLETLGLGILGLIGRQDGLDLGSQFTAVVTIAQDTGPGSLVSVLVWANGTAIFALALAARLIADAVRLAWDPRECWAARPAVRPLTASAAVRERLPGNTHSTESGALLTVRSLNCWTVEDKGLARRINGISFTLDANASMGILSDDPTGRRTLTQAPSMLAPTPPNHIVGGQILLGDEDLVAAPLRRLRQLRGAVVAQLSGPPEPRSDLGFALETWGLAPHLTVERQIMDALRAHGGKADRATVDALLEEVGCRQADRVATSPAGILSAADCAVAALARALAPRPKLLVVTDRTADLDSIARSAFLDGLDRVRRERALALLFASDDAAAVYRLCDRVLILYAGKVVESGTPTQILEDPRHPFTRSLLAALIPVAERPSGLVPLPGPPADLVTLPAGCQYAPRCRWVADACRLRPISLQEQNDGRHVRCCRVSEIQNA